MSELEFEVCFRCKICSNNHKTDQCSVACNICNRHQKYCVCGLNNSFSPLPPPFLVIKRLY